MSKKIQFFNNLRMKSSTFYLASLWLPIEKREDVAKLYFFCRYLDDLADQPTHTSKDQLHTILNDVENANTNHPISQHIHNIIEKHNIPNSVPIALIKGIQKDFTNVKIESQQSLLHYAYEVAGTVGIMMAHILDTKTITALYHAIDLSIAMQLTNIARDVYEDAFILRRYLPGTWVNHLSPKDIVAMSASTQIIVNKAIYKIIQLAEQYYISGMGGIQYLPNQYHNAIFKSAHLYQQIGHNILNNHRPFQETKKRLHLIKKIPILLKKQTFSSSSTTHSINLHTDINHLPFTHYA